MLRTPWRRSFGIQDSNPGSERVFYNTELFVPPIHTSGPSFSGICAIRLRLDLTVFIISKSLGYFRKSSLYFPSIAVKNWTEKYFVNLQPAVTYLGLRRRGYISVQVAYPRGNSILLIYQAFQCRSINVVALMLRLSKFVVQNTTFKVSTQHTLVYKIKAEKQHLA